MSIALLKMTIKKNWILLLIFFGVLTMYITIMISMYKPDEMDELMSVLKFFPEELIKAMGFNQMITNLTTYLASWLYGMLMITLPMVYSIILGNRLVAQTVDSGSMACLLSTPNSRLKIVVTKGAYAICSVGVLQMLVFAIGVLMSEAVLSGVLDVEAFLKLNVTAMLVNMAVMSITFFFSCLFNDTKYSLGFGSGIPIMFLLFNMLGGASSDAEILKKISIFGWYDPVELVNGASTLGVNLVYLGITVVLFIAGVLIFKHKKLPI